MPRQSKSKKIAVWAATLVLLQACSKQAPQKPFVARVDQALLTEEALAASQDTLGGTAQRRQQYINEWINTELLHQEALRLGIPENEDLRRKIESATRTMIIGALLEQELYVDENISEDEIIALYNGGGEAFRLREDVVSASYALFNDRDAANIFRGKLVNGAAWIGAVEETHRDSLLKPHVLQVVTRRFFTQSNLYPTELWKLAKSLGKDEVSFAVKTNAGYYILVAHDMKKQGDLPALEYIHGEIRDRIVIERRRLRYEKLLQSLRSTHSVEVRLTQADTSSQINE